MDTDQSDSEWEYEYDTTETETFYVTLDLTSATQDTLSRAQRDKPKVAIDAPTLTTRDKPADDRLPAQTSSSTATKEQSLGPRVQILDLHSENPLISFDGHLYSCTWTRTLGTDLILAGPDVELPFEPAHQEARFQIAALSDIRLMGKTANLVPKQALAVPDEVPMDIGASDRIKIPLSATVTDEKRKQAAFLERLAAVKRAKGDEDEVFISKGKSYQDFRRGAQSFNSPGTQEKAKGKRKQTPRKAQSRDVMHHRGGDTEFPQSPLAGPSVPAGREGMQSEASDVDMHDAG